MLSRYRLVRFIVDIVYNTFRSYLVSPARKGLKIITAFRGQIQIPDVSGQSRWIQTPTLTKEVLIVVDLARKLEMGRYVY